MTTQVTLTIPELCALIHALDVRVADFERILQNELALSEPCYSEQLIAYYEGEITEAKSALGKLALANLHFTCDL
jgi:hypothetical protein